MKVRCFSNVDDFRNKQWPDEFTCEPQIGDFVEADDGTLAKITSRYHSVEKKINSDSRIPGTPYMYYTPILKVYLSKIGV